MTQLTFMMGEFHAKFPIDRLYATNHMWGQVTDEGANDTQLTTIRFGFTAYAVRLLQDVYFLDWTVDCPATLREKQQIGGIESKKAESDLFAPIAGRISKINEELLSDPSTINVDKYGQGWLFEIEGSTHSLMTAEGYLEHLTGVWEITQRTIKGQLNE